jgi:PKD repeat protein
MNFHLLTRPGRLLALGLLAWASLGTEAWAQAQPTIDSAKQPPRPTSATLRASKKVAATSVSTNLRSMPNPHLEESLQLLYQESASLRSSGPVALRSALQASHPDLKFSNGSAAAPAVLVRITAKDVVALLPSLTSRGFMVVASYPQLHFVEGTLPISQLSGDGRGVEALAAQGLMGVLASYRPENHVGLVTSQADYVLEAARTRAYRRTSTGAGVSGAGVRIGVLSDSFDALKGAATDVASGDLPAAGVQVLSDITGSTDEGRAMCQLIHDLAPDSPLAFSTAYNSEGDFARHIRDLADVTKGNCKVIVDDVAYFTEPYFQDGVIAQAVNDVVASGVSYFSSAGNNDNASYENAAPRFVADAANPTKRVLNFDATGTTTDTKQRIILAAPTASVAAGNFRPFLQWSDPFYTVGGVKTNLDLYLIAVKNGVPGDTVARGRNNNIVTNTPSEDFSFTNTTATGTTTFDLVIVLRGGVAPTRVKYLNQGTTDPTEWFGASTIVGHTAAASAISVAAVRYYDQRVPEYFTSLGGALPFLFSPEGVALATPELRQKPNIASIDGTDTSFFGGADNDGSGFPNFFGTSAAAPHAAAVAALLLSAEPSLTPAQVASRLIGSARLLGTSAADPLTGPGLIDAFTTLYGPPVAVAAPYIEDFEKAVLPTNWLVNSTRAGRVQVLNNDAPNSGKYQLLLDASVLYLAPTAVQSLNEATCYLNNSAGGNLQLSFRQRRYAAETDEQMPTQFTGSSATDGVALSVDGGTTWYRIFDLTGNNSTTSYQTNVVNLTQFAAANGLTLGADVRLKFQQYGGGAATGASIADRRGRVFDDIALTALNPGPVALLNAGPATTGCPGLQVQYADTSLFRPTAYAWTFPGGTPATSTQRNQLVTYNTPGHYAVTLSVRNAAGTSTRTDTGFVFVSGRVPQVTVTNTNPSVCRSGTVTFRSSALYCPTSYQWSFPGGTPASSTSPSPGAITYAAAGSYPATLVVSNAFGSVTNTIIVDVDGRTLPFAETFDNSNTLPRGWALVTPSTYPWTLADDIIGRSGVTSRALLAPFADDDQVGEYPSVYTPAINLTGITKPTLLFDVAYGPFALAAGAVPTDIDSLTIRVADACTGTILGRPYSKGTLNGLPTSASTPNYFIPASGSDWRQELVDLTPYAGKSIIIQFRGYNGFGNSLFIDNVQVGNSLLSLTSAASAVGLEAWPVPTPRGTSLNLRLPAYTGSVSLRLVDNLGRTVWQQQVQQSGGALERTLALPFAPGLYNLLYTPAGGTPAARRVVLE